MHVNFEKAIKTLIERWNVRKPVVGSVSLIARKPVEGSELYVFR